MSGDGWRSTPLPSDKLIRHFLFVTDLILSLQYIVDIFKQRNRFRIPLRLHNLSGEVQFTIVPPHNYLFPSVRDTIHNLQIVRCGAGHGLVQGLSSGG